MFCSQKHASATSTKDEVSAAKKILTMHLMCFDCHTTDDSFSPLLSVISMRNLLCDPPSFRFNMKHHGKL